MAHCTAALGFIPGAACIDIEMASGATSASSATATASAGPDDEEETHSSATLWTACNA